LIKVHSDGLVEFLRTVQKATTKSRLKTRKKIVHLKIYCGNFKGQKPIGKWKKKNGCDYFAK